MSLVRPDTMRKKIVGNIEAIDKKIEAIDKKAETEKAGLVLQKEIWSETLEKLDKANPPLPFKPAIDPAGTTVNPPAEDEKNQEKLPLDADGKKADEKKPEEKKPELDKKVEEKAPEKKVEQKKPAHVAGGKR